MFSMLGIDFAKDGKKSVPWSTKVKALGVMIDLAPEGAAVGKAGRFVTRLYAVKGRRVERNTQRHFAAGCNVTKRSREVER